MMSLRNLATGLLLLTLSACTLGTQISETDIPEGWLEYQNLQRNITVRYPPDWTLVNEDLTDSPLHTSTIERTSLNPPDYIATNYPYLLTIDVSKFNLEQNLQFVELDVPQEISRETVPFGDEDGYRIIGTDKLSIGRVVYLLPTASGISFKITLRTNDPETLKTLEQIIKASTFRIPKEIENAEDLLNDTNNP